MRPTLFALATVCSVLTFAPQSLSAQTVADALAAVQAGDIAGAQEILEARTAEGDPEAMRNLARLLISGTVQKADPARARTLLEQSVAAGNLPAQMDLAYLHLNGVGGPVDRAQAEALFAKAAAAGSTEAIFMRARTALEIGKDADSIQAALKDIQGLLPTGYPPALAFVGQMFRSGTFVPKKVDEAIKYYQSAAEKGDVESLAVLGEIYAFAETGTADLEKAKEWYEKAASAGDSGSAYALAYILYNDPNSDDDALTRAFDYAQTAALAWNEDAQSLLGRMYLEDRAVPKDAYQAYKWLDLAASAAVIDAHFLRAMAEAELGPEQTAAAHAEAAKWFAENHNVPHNHRLLQGGVHSMQAR